MPFGLSRRGWAVAALILLVALVARIGVIEATPDYRPLSDSADYDRHALSLQAGNGYPPSRLTADEGPTAFRPPAYPMFLASVYGLTFQRWKAARLAQALLGVLTVALIGLLALRLTASGAVAAVAAGIAAIWPAFISTSESLLSESLFLPFEIGAVLAALAGVRDGRKRWLALAGALCGLAWLTRGNALVLLIPVAIGVWTARPRFSRPALVAPAIVLGAAALTIAPWTLRNASLFDSFVPVSTQPGYALAGTYSPEASEAFGGRALWQQPERLDENRDLFRDDSLDEAELSSELGDRATDYLVDNPLYPFEVAWWNTPRFLGLSSIHYERAVAGGLGADPDLAEAGFWAFIVLIPLVLLGIASRRAGAIPRWIWLVPLLFAASSIFVLGFSRYRMAADPFLILLAAIGIVWAFDRLRHRAAGGPDALPGV